MSGPPPIASEIATWRNFARDPIPSDVRYHPDSDMRLDIAEVRSVPIVLQKSEIGRRYFFRPNTMHPSIADEWGTTSITEVAREIFTRR